jgi:hypothetical protein
MFRLRLVTKEGSMADEKKLKLKLSLKKETLRELKDSQLDTLDQVVGGTCVCGSVTGGARTVYSEQPMCDYSS